MGVAALGVCHETREDAALYTCAVQFPQSIFSGVEWSHYSCSSVSGFNITVTKTTKSFTTNVVSSSSLFQGVNGPSCDPSPYTSRVITATSSPFDLSLSEGALVASAVLAVWGIAACWRELAAFINQGGNSNEDLK